MELRHRNAKILHCGLLLLTVRRKSVCIFFSVSPSRLFVLIAVYLVGGTAFNMFYREKNGVAALPHFDLFLFLFAVRIIRACALFISPFFSSVMCWANGNDWDFDPQTKMGIYFVQATAILSITLLDPLPSPRTILQIDVGRRHLLRLGFTRHFVIREYPNRYTVMCTFYLNNSIYACFCVYLLCACVSLRLFAVKHALFLDTSIKFNLTCVVDWCYFLLLFVCMCVCVCVDACVRVCLCVSACRKSAPPVERAAQVHLAVTMMKELRWQLEAVVLAKALASQVLRKPAMTLCRFMHHYEPPLCRLCAAHFYTFVRWCGYLFQCMLCDVMSSPRTSL